jgi:hypothetical protein
MEILFLANGFFCMAKVAGLETEKLVKTTLFLGVEDVLVPGKIDSKIDNKAVKEILKNLLLLEKKVPGFHFFVLTGYNQKIGTELLEKNGLFTFLLPGHCFFVNEEYLSAKEPVDREIYEQEIKKDPLFKDEYFKQVMVNQLNEKFSIPKEKMVMIGHDLFFGAFYTNRFSGIDFALIRSALSMRGQKYGQPIRGLTYINRSWSDIRKLLTGQFPVPDYGPLKNAIQSLLGKELISSQTMQGIVEARRKQLEKRGTENA